MRRLIWTIGLAGSMLAGAVGMMAQTTEAVTPEAQARELTRQIVAKQYAEVEKSFDKAMLAALPTDKLQQTWEGLLEQVGAEQEVESANTAQQDGYRVVQVTVKFEKTTLNLKWVFDGKGLVAGFFIKPL